MMETAMFKIIQTSFSESENRMAMALRLESPLFGKRYTFQFGLKREARSNLDDVEGYSRRVDDYRKSIELSANP